MRNRRRFRRGPVARTAHSSVPNNALLPVEGGHQGTQERLVAEIRHELGNFFHKLYYWVDFIREGTGKAADSTASEMLEHTISDFEDFLRITLDYFSPVHLSFVKVPFSQLLDSLLTAAGFERESPEVFISRDARVEEAALLVDPGYISKAFAITFARMRGQFKNSSLLAVSVGATQLNGFGGFEVSISADRGHPTSPLLRPAAAGVQWAVARRLFEMHGGEMSEEQEDRGQVKAVRIFLPVYV